MLDDEQNNKDTMKAVLVILKIAQRFCSQKLSFFWSLFAMKAKIVTIRLLEYSNNGALFRRRKKLKAFRVHQFVLS